MAILYFSAVKKLTKKYFFIFFEIWNILPIVQSSVVISVRSLSITLSLHWSAGTLDLYRLLKGVLSSLRNIVIISQKRIFLNTSVFILSFRTRVYVHTYQCMCVWTYVPQNVMDILHRQRKTWNFSLSLSLFFLVYFWLLFHSFILFTLNFICRFVHMQLDLFVPFYGFQCVYVSVWKINS